jgi:2-oxoglutarate dehydrogenase E1 component
MLRAQDSRSSVEQLERGAFAHVLDDPEVTDPAGIRRMVLASGKMAHEALRRRREMAAGGGTASAEIAIVRIEQLYPWPIAELSALFERYTRVEEVVWLQEEPENMGAWSFVHARLHAALPGHIRLRHVSRGESASPAIGSAALHQLEQSDLLRRAIG